MASVHPTIGLNCSFRDATASTRDELFAPVAYADAIARAGGVPLHLPPVQSPRALAAFIAQCDGFCLIGGDDYWPEHYGGRVQPASQLMARRRDCFDWELGQRVVLRTSKPVFGVCGGQQLITILLGGTLVQDLPSEWERLTGRAPLIHSGDQKHAVRVAPDSLLRSILGLRPGAVLTANSTHHQAATPGRVGEGMRAVAWTEDGVIEALEPAPGSRFARAGRFLLGVQWHPERLADQRPHLALFKALVRAARYGS